MLLHLPKRSRKKLVTKKCAYPGCTKTYRGIGPTRYCKQHRTEEARAYIAKLCSARRREEAAAMVDDVNQTITHKFVTVCVKKCVCSLDGCNEEFEIRIVPHVHVYPKYCPNHRTEWRRNWHLAQLSQHG